MAKTNKLYESVLKQLKSDITSGKYPLNSKLPTEEELSKRYSISRSTLRKVLETLKSKNYIESKKGSGSFVCNKNIVRYIPVIISGYDSNYRKTEILKGVQDYFNEVGFSSLPTFTEYNPEKETEQILDLVNQNHKNFIVYPMSSKNNVGFYQKLFRQGINFVFLDTLPNDITCDYVASCNFLGGYTATKKFIELGHKKIAFCSFTSPKNVNTVNERFLGYVSALAQNGLDYTEDLVFIEEESPREDFINKLIKKCSEITAVFAATDELALILMNKLAYMNIKVAICGFDNSLMAENAQLATIDQNAYEIGKIAAELMYKRISDPGKCFEHIFVPVTFIERESLKPE